MEIHARKPRAQHIQDQENINALKGKTNVLLPLKRQGLGVRGALGELNTNIIQANRETVGKVAVTAAEFEKKSKNRCNYSHVQSKVDTGLAVKTTVQPTLKPILRREESTAGLAVKAAVRTRAASKDTQLNKINEKECLNVYVQTKKYFQDKKTKESSCKETKEKKKTVKPILKEPIESLGKLQLDECNTKNKSDQHIPQPTKKKVETVSLPLPEDIEDIDANDDNNPLLMSIYIKDIYTYLTELEKKYAIEPDYLKRQTAITGKMRATLIDWLVEVQHQFSLILETFHLTVGIIDRYLQAVPNVQRNQLQLVGVTALYIASKYEEIYPPDVRDFVYVTDNAYTKQEVFQCERDMMAKLGFCLARPIPLSFLRRFVKAAHGTTKIHHLAKYFVDLCLVEYSMAHYHPSELAAAALCLSLHLLLAKTLEALWTPTLKYYSGYSLHHIEPIIKKIAKIVIDVDSSKCKAVYNKYLDVTLAKVAALPQLRSNAIYALAEDVNDFYLI